MSVKSGLEKMLLQLLEAEKSQTSSDVARQYYADLHKDRFADTLRLCQSCIPNPFARVLDVGRSELTAHLLKLYSNLTTLGIDVCSDDGGHRELKSMETVPHIVFDLLHSHRIDSWPECKVFDLIVFSEVLEHLSIAPEFVFAFLNSLLGIYGRRMGRPYCDHPFRGKQRNNAKRLFCRRPMSLAYRARGSSASYSV